MEGFLEFYNESHLDDETIIKHLFWRGMGNILGKMLLLGEDRFPFTEFTENTLWLCNPPSL